MVQKIAVALVHGMGEQNRPDLEDSTQILTNAIQAATDGNAAIRLIHWAPAVQQMQNLLRTRLAAIRQRQNYGVFRHFILSYIGDAIAYQQTPHDRRVYDTIHAVFAADFAQLAATAGGSAPLLIIAHSLGTIITSNYLWDLQNDSQAKPLISEQVRAVMQGTPLERGHTLTGFYTLGAPFPLWSLRYADFGTPIQVPAPELATHHPALTGEWLNLYDQDDAIAYPIQSLSAAYAKAVTADHQVDVGRFYENWNPLSHIAYWRDPDSVGILVDSVERIYRDLNGG
jgi:pimeloyl-ACP methyl ester carboxylesterase